MAEKQRRLDELVEGYAIRPVVESDANRLIQETKARELRKGTQMDMGDKAQLFKNHGYTIDTLMKDIRFKISAVLGEAGLAKTAYGSQLIKGVAPTAKYTTGALKSNTQGLW